MNKKSYRSIISRLISTRNSISRCLAVEGFVDLLTFIGGFIFIVWFITGLFWPGPTYRVILLIAGIIGILTLTGLGIFRPILKGQPLANIALRLEKFYGKLQSRLIASLQLYDKLSANKENYSVELIEKTIEEAGQEIKDLDFNVAVQKRKRPYQRLALSVLSVILAFAISGQTLSHVKTLYAQPLANIPRPTSLKLFITPLSYQAVKNDDVTVKITASGEKTRRVDLNFRFDDGKWVTVLAEKLSDDEGQSDSVFTYTFRKVKRNIEYFAQVKNVRSEPGKITVIDPPALVDVSITLDFPEYTGLQTQRLPNNDGSVMAIKGTGVRFEGRLNKAVKSAYLAFDNGERKQLTIDDRKISGRFTITQNGSYSVEVADSAGLKNLNPIEYDLVCLEDYAPQVKITFPAVDVDLDESMLVPIEAVLYDDFGFSKLELVYWTFSDGLESSKSRQVLRKDFGMANDILFIYEWFLERLYMMPGDLAYYYLEVFDNDAISSPKSSVSKTYSARLPSLDEIMADITGSQDEMFEDFGKAVQSQKELKDELEQLSREMLKLSEVDWEKKQQIQSTLDRQKEISEKLDQIAEQMDKAIEKFEKNQMATVEMLEKMEELRDLFEEVATPELKEAMKKLQDALKEMDLDKLKEAMKNFELSVEQINKNLDRMLALLKKYQLEQKLDTMAKMAEKLAEQQDQINKQLGQCQGKKDFSDLQKPQQQQEQGLENLRDQFDEAQQLNQELNMIPQQQMQQAGQKVNSKKTDQAMSQMMQSMGMCNGKQCSKSGDQLQQDFQNMAQMFQEMLEQMQSEQLEMVTEMLKKAIADVLYLSHSQENVIDSTQKAVSRLESRREIASQQKDIETATERTAQCVSDITKETLFLNSAVMSKLGTALNGMQEAIGKLNGRQPSRAKSNQVDAMTALNQAIEMLMSALSQASQCQSSCSGMQSLMKKLSQMAQQQQCLNQQCQGMMPMPMPGQVLGMSQQQAMQRLAAQQEALSKSLQELHEEYSEGGDNNVLGRLDKLAEEMKKVADQLQNKSFNRNTIFRQERILSRLLDAQKSVHRRDYSRRRQARAAEDIIRRGPSALFTGDSNNEKLAEDIRKALAEKYPRRYENQIKEYFKALAEDEAVEQ